MACHWKFLPVAVVVVIMSCGCGSSGASASAAAAMTGKTPEAPSTLLRIHKLYQQQRPHDTALYDTLQVLPNATAAQITKSYRKLSRRYHPDKATTTSTAKDAPKKRLQAVRDAYEVLKEDATRLPYHRYGLVEASDAAFILTGSSSGNFSPDQARLLELMGHNLDVGGVSVPDDTATTRRSSSRRASHEDRVLFLAASLVERMRPLVEGAITPAHLVDRMARECATLRKLPLGAQILRCIGRAYRHAGQSALRELRFKKAGELSNVLRANMHKTKHILEAAAAGGRFLVKDKKLKQQQAQRKGLDGANSAPRIGYYDDENDDDDDYENDQNLDDDINQDEHFKANVAALESLQIEALWKVSKIHLDRTIQEACRFVLNGQYFFFPSHFSSSRRHEWEVEDDGWVSSKGQTIQASVGRVRAASALIIMGDAMVKCAKGI